MEIAAILEKFGFKAGDDGDQPIRLRLFYINNPDGTVRWFWPASSTHPLFLKFYHISGWKSKLFKLLTLFLFKLRLQHVLFHRTSLTGNCENTSKQLISEHADWAVFTGTPGPNRKAIAYIVESGMGSFIKISLGDKAKMLLSNELKTLEYLKKTDRITFSFPESGGLSDQLIKLSDISVDGVRLGEFTRAHELALVEIRNETLIPTPLESLLVWNKAKENLAYVSQMADPRIPGGLIRKLKEIISGIHENQYIDACLSHGDFTPWNMYLNAEGTLGIYDWELSRTETPFGFDAFHFIIQDAILVQRKSWREIEQSLQETLFNKSTLFSKYTVAQQQLYLKLYLVINTTYYLTIYQNQKDWHAQIGWLLNTWNEALSSMLASSKSNRELVLMDTVDFLMNENYAALKYHNELPERLSEFSDIDFCITRYGYQKVARYLDHHILVKNRQFLKKSFMASEHLVLQDGSMLSFDFIWKMKRAYLEMMDVKKILYHARMSVYGVRVAEPVDNARYAALFYALNGADIPAKFLHYRNDLLSISEHADHLLAEYYQNEVSHDRISKYVSAQSVNKGIHGVLNRINYAIDALKEIMSMRGMVITFSGVDGAGKSTVIENLKTRIEKQLRKRVVVLRHRPSLLPILSAWTKGKAAAELEAASKLPRQGNNKNTFSSLVRFSYYYIDYLLGQWYVIAKYVMRGYVVLYDRYYFDFINDSRRSNIELPRFLTQWAYIFIKEPDFNFFLYANAELILSRKKELDRSTIEELTHKYLILFRKLNNKRPAHQRYIPIENVEMASTLQLIMKKVSSPV